MTPKSRKTKMATKPIRKAIKTLSEVLGATASKRGVMSEKMKDLLKEAKMRKPSGRINRDDLKRIMEEKKLGKIKRKLSPAKMPNQPNFRSRPEKPKGLGPIRSIRERAKQSRIVKNKPGRPKK